MSKFIYKIKIQCEIFCTFHIKSDFFYLFLMDALLFVLLYTSFGVYTIILSMKMKEFFLYIILFMSYVIAILLYYKHEIYLFLFLFNVFITCVLSNCFTREDIQKKKKKKYKYFHYFIYLFFF